MGKKAILMSLLAVAAVVALLVVADRLSERGPKIQTAFASYGYAMNRKDVKDDVMKYCDGKASCSFKVANENLSSHLPADPSPGDDKGLMISWKCGDVVQKEQFAEGKDAKLSCK